MKKNYQMCYIFFNTHAYNLFVIEKVKILSFILKDICTQSDHAHVHEGERQG